MAIDPVLGTLAGAGLVGGLGFLTQRSHAKREERRRWETTRYEAALGVLATSDRISNVCANALAEINLGHAGYPDPEDFLRLIDELATAAARLDLVCSHAEGQALLHLQSAVHLMMKATSNGAETREAFDAYAEARERFVTVVRQELGP